jgi:hypothetical protein
MPVPSGWSSNSENDKLRGNLTGVASISPRNESKHLRATFSPQRHHCISAVAMA